MRVGIIKKNDGYNIINICYSYYDYNKSFCKYFDALKMSEFAIKDPLEKVDECVGDAPQVGNVSTDICIIPNSADQDHTVIIKNLINVAGLLILYAVFTFDGHGRGRVIDLIRKTSLETVAFSEDQFATLQQIIADDCQKDPLNHFRDGSTFVMTLVFEGYIITQSFGDSTALVYINGSLEYKTLHHSVSQNESEFDRISSMKDTTIIPGKQVSVLDEDTITMTVSNQVKFPNGDSLSPSCSLGHAGITGGEPITKILLYNKGDTVDIIQFSDGVGDMLNANGSEYITLLYLSSEEICKRAISRWKQKWTYKKADGTTLRTLIGKGNDADDVCCSKVHFTA